MKGKQKEEGSGALKILGVTMIVFGILYAVLGTLSLLGITTGPFPGHENQEPIIVTLSYITLVVSILGGSASIKGNMNNIKTIGVIFATIGFISLIYTLLTQKVFNNFDCITIVLGIGIIILATIAKMENDKIKAIKESKRIAPKVQKSKEINTTSKEEKETTEKVVPKTEKPIHVKSSAKKIKQLKKTYSYRKTKNNKLHYKSKSSNTKNKNSN